MATLEELAKQIEYAESFHKEFSNASIASSAAAYGLHSLAKDVRRLSQPPPPPPEEEC